MKIVFISSVIAFFSLKNAILTLIILIWNNGQNGIFLPHLMALSWENMRSIFSPGCNGCINKYTYIHENGLKQKSAMKKFFLLEFWQFSSLRRINLKTWWLQMRSTTACSQFEFLNKNVSAFFSKTVHNSYPQVFTEWFFFNSFAWVNWVNQWIHYVKHFHFWNICLRFYQFSINNWWLEKFSFRNFFFTQFWIAVTYIFNWKSYVFVSLSSKKEQKGLKVWTTVLW